MPPANRAVARRSAVSTACLGAVLAACLLAACRSVPASYDEVVGVQPPRDARAAEAGAARAEAAVRARRTALDAAARRGELDADAAALARLRGIVVRLAAASAALRPESAAWTWQAHLLPGDAVDAWCLPGGLLAARVGAVAQAGLTDDELAALLAHAVAHALRNHDAERVAGAPHGRAHEIEADRLGAELAARAGYDPRAAETFWRKADAPPAAAGGAFTAWSVAHPSPPDRARALSTYAQRFAPLYEGARGIIRSP